MEAFAGEESSRSRAMPKSSTFSCRLAREEEVLRLEVAVDDARARARRRARRAGRRRCASTSRTEPAARLARAARLDGLALEQLHHQEHGAVLGDVVVEHPDAPGCSTRVGDVALAQEARARLLVLATARGGGSSPRRACPLRCVAAVDDGHPAEAQQARPAATCRAGPGLRAPPGRKPSGLTRVIGEDHPPARATWVVASPARPAEPARPARLWRRGRLTGARGMTGACVTPVCRRGA